MALLPLLLLLMLRILLLLCRLLLLPLSQLLMSLDLLLQQASSICPWCAAQQLSLRQACSSCRCCRRRSCRSVLPQLLRPRLLPDRCHPAALHLHHKIGSSQQLRRVSSHDYRPLPLLLLLPALLLLLLLLVLAVPLLPPRALAWPPQKGPHQRVLQDPGCHFGIHRRQAVIQQQHIGILLQ